jgi:hypothetical protein
MNIKVSVASLRPSDFEGYMTKQGGKIKTWKKRWFVLKGNFLHYFKTKKDKDVTGTIDVNQITLIKTQEDDKHFLFTVETPGRTYFFYPETADSRQQWIDILNQTKSKINGVNKKNDVVVPVDVLKLSVREKLNLVKENIQYLSVPNTSTMKLAEFWRAWYSSLPTLEDVKASLAIEPISFDFTTSASMSKVVWRFVLIGCWD